ncbi:unnamed protein product [Closterium sp. Naga37s-1]|nr:unnamed protein product [Closterium sp. Naga37s-1]
MGKSLGNTIDPDEMVTTFGADADGHKMGESLGNTIDPDKLVTTYGADADGHKMGKSLGITIDPDELVTTFARTRWQQPQRAMLLGVAFEAILAPVAFPPTTTTTTTTTPTTTARYHTPILRPNPSHSSPQMATAAPCHASLDFSGMATAAACYAALDFSGACEMATAAACYAALDFSGACEAILAPAAVGNGFLEERAPWSKFKKGPGSRVGDGPGSSVGDGSLTWLQCWRQLALSLWLAPITLTLQSMPFSALPVPCPSLSTSFHPSSPPSPLGPGGSLGDSSLCGRGALPDQTHWTMPFSTSIPSPLPPTLPPPFLPHQDLVAVLETARCLPILMNSTPPTPPSPTSPPPSPPSSSPGALPAETHWGGLKAGQETAEPAPVLARIEQEEGAEAGAQAGGKGAKGGKGKGEGECCRGEEAAGKETEGEECRIE